MKKIIALVLAAVLATALCACGKKAEKKPDPNAVDAGYYAKLGQIKECEYALGTKAEDIKNALDVESYDEFENGDKTMVTTGTVTYYYNTDDDDKAINCITSFNTAYGMAIGTPADKVKETMQIFGNSAELRSAKQGELFFIPGGVGLEVLSYTFGENTLLFVFQNNELCATALTS